MAAILTPQVFRKSPAHCLRALSVLTFPPGFFFLLIQGIASSHVNPAIGIVPLFFSAAYSGLLLANDNKSGYENSSLTGTPIHLVCDLLLGIGLLVCLILTWIFLPNRWSGGDVMLGTYCTNFLIVNFLAHCYFTFIQLKEAAHLTSYPQFPHGPFSTAFQGKSRNGYDPLIDREGEPGISTEGGPTTAESAV